MFGSLDGKPIDGVVVDHMGYSGEGSAKLSQDVLVPIRLLDSHMHKPVAAPVIDSTLGKYNSIY